MERLLRMLTQLHPEVTFTPDTRHLEEELLDSFDIVTLVSEIDEEYGVVIPAQELIPENFATGTALYRLIRRLGEG